MAYKDGRRAGSVRRKTLWLGAAPTPVAERMKRTGRRNMLLILGDQTHSTG